MKHRRWRAVALVPSLFVTTVVACPVALRLDAAGGGRPPLRLDFERSEYREQGGTWRSLARRCRSVADVTRCRLDSQCGPHQFLLRVELLTGVTTSAVLGRSMLFPQAGWVTLTSGQTLAMDSAELRARVDTAAGAGRVAR